MDADGVRNLPVGRHLAVDERGVGLRATWRLDQGFVNLSFWRDDTCVETFHLDPTAAAGLISFLVQGLADVTTTAASGAVHHLAAARPRVSFRARLAQDVRSLRQSTASKLVDLSKAIRPT